MYPIEIEKPRALEDRTNSRVNANGRLKEPGINKLHNLRYVMK